MNFSYNKIKEVTTDKGINTNNLSLAGNVLKTFPKDLFTADSPLAILNLSGNQIEEITNDDIKVKNVYDDKSWPVEIIVWRNFRRMIWMEPLYATFVW